jgi:hypothetical protein
MCFYENSPCQFVLPAKICFITPTNVDKPQFNGRNQKQKRTARLSSPKSQRRRDAKIRKDILQDYYGKIIKKLSIILPQLSRVTTKCTLCRHNTSANFRPAQMIA